MTPLAHQLHLFRQNKRGFAAFCLFMLLFVVSLFAEFIANDVPIIVKFHGQYYIPIFRFYPETTFGGDFLTEADYRDSYIADKIRADGWMVWPLIHYSYQTINYDAVPAPSPPSRDNWLGTDDQGRDVLARLIYGFRISVLFALALTTASSAIGITAGLVQGFFGGITDLIMQRIIEIWEGLPMLFMLMILASIIAPSFFTLLALMIVFSWMSLVQYVRAESLRARNADYVRSARALGVPEWQIALRHVLPNAVVSAVTYIPFVFSAAIATLTSLDFLGFGLPPGSPSLGELVAQGKTNLHAPWLGITAFITLAVMLSLLIFIGEAARDALDPRKAIVA